MTEGGQMKGLELSEQYYLTYGKPMLEKQFPQLKGRVAAGLVGRGSECFGFDDEISRDHDYGPSFCLWLTAEDYQEYGRELQNAYDALPGAFLGMPKRQIMAQGGGRVGVLQTELFYQELLGMDHPPMTDAQWLSVPEEGLATAVNGSVFEDPLMKFTAFREKLLSYYPDSVRKRKMAQCAALMAQAGQYNYGRAMARGEYIAAQLALSEFIKNSMSMVYLINGVYAPFYKWMHRGMKKLTVLSEVGDMLMLLTDVTDSKQVWRNRQTRMSGKNTEDAREKKEASDSGLQTDGKLLIIEAVCQVIIQELQNMKLTDSSDSYMEVHARNILNSIKEKG